MDTSSDSSLRWHSGYRAESRGSAGQCAHQPCCLLRQGGGAGSGRIRPPSKLLPTLSYIPSWALLHTPSVVTIRDGTS